jgi:hypothetical protein
MILLGQNAVGGKSFQDPGHDELFSRHVEFGHNIDVAFVGNGELGAEMAHQEPACLQRGFGSHFRKLVDRIHPFSLPALRVVHESGADVCATAALVNQDPVKT